ncbi:DUF7504 family protein [Halobacterium litoreum]|uniref:DUF835 domain-containing protein n=1 Tax=Halobacterium litoreum TaxID=2039234 RepID=A0ABD5NDL5_9EURY|nr:hypothetical protein [Halobacterium litoreum]UHH13851.1 hypothetical protein LT972_02370 [Halobacterium litoreum]
MNGEAATPFDDLSAGEVVLCVHPSGDRIVEVLPPAAFENLLLLTTNGDLRRLERIVSAHGNPNRVGVVPITGSSVNYDGPLWTTDRVNPGDLTGVSIQFSEAFKHVRPDDGWVVVDNIGVLSMYVSRERLFRLVDSVANAVRERNARCVLATARGVLGESGLAQCRGLANREVSLD